MSSPRTEAGRALDADAFGDLTDRILAIEAEAQAALIAEVEGLRALSDSATDGPWTSGAATGLGHYVRTGNDDFLTGPIRKPNAALIVAAVNLVRDLLARSVAPNQRDPESEQPR